MTKFLSQLLTSQTRVLAFGLLCTLSLSGCYTKASLCSDANRVDVPNLAGSYELGIFGEGNSRPGTVAYVKLSPIENSKNFNFDMTTQYEDKTEVNNYNVSLCAVAGKTVMQFNSEAAYQFVLLSPKGNDFTFEQRGFSRALLQQNGVPFEEYKVTEENLQPMAHNSGIAPEKVLQSLDMSEGAWTSTFQLSRK